MKFYTLCAVLLSSLILSAYGQTTKVEGRKIYPRTDGKYRTKEQIEAKTGRKFQNGQAISILRGTPIAESDTYDSINLNKYTEASLVIRNNKGATYNGKPLPQLNFPKGMDLFIIRSPDGEGFCYAEAMANPRLGIDISKPRDKNFIQETQNIKSDGGIGVGMWDVNRRTYDYYNRLTQNLADNYPDRAILAGKNIRRMVITGVTGIRSVVCTTDKEPSVSRISTMLAQYFGVDNMHKEGESYEIIGDLEKDQMGAEIGPFEVKDTVSDRWSKDCKEKAKKMAQEKIKADLSKKKWKIMANGHHVLIRHAIDTDDYKCELVESDDKKLTFIWSGHDYDLSSDAPGREFGIKDRYADGETPPNCKFHGYYMCRSIQDFKYYVPRESQLHVVPREFMHVGTKKVPSSVKAPAPIAPPPTTTAPVIKKPVTRPVRIGVDYDDKFGDFEVNRPKRKSSRR